MLTEILTFVRAVELKSISAAARELRVTSSSASARIMHLEDQLGVRLLNRTTRAVHPTEAGALFYPHALEVLHAMEQAKASMAAAGGELAGTLRITAPLGFGRRFLAPLMSQFRARHPRIEARLRLSDHDPDMVLEAADLSIRVGPLPPSDLVVRKLADCPQVLAASPAYLAGHGAPRGPSELLTHSCLVARTHNRERSIWSFRTEEGVVRLPVSGRLEADDSAVLTDWALEGAGVVLKPAWEIAEHLRSGALLPILMDAEPEPLALSLLYPSKRMFPVKARIFAEFLVERLGPMLREAGAYDTGPATPPPARAA